MRTELDARFSQPGATATTWEQARARIAGAELSWLTTVRADGRPHMTPLVAVWHDERPYFCTGTEEQKAVNLAGNPQVILATGDGRWEDGLDVVVEGEAVRVTDRALLERLAAAWRDRWDGRWAYAVGDGGFEARHGVAAVYEVRIAKVLAFGKGAFTHTRHVP